MGIYDRIGVILQVRMGSRRLNRKTLRPLADRPMLVYVLERLAQCRSSAEIVVATSTRREDDAIEAFCREHHVACFRGDHENVSLRVKDTLDEFGFDAFVRVCGDSIFIDPELIDGAIGRFRAGAYQVVTNNLHRTFPAGQTVEIVDTEVFRRAYPRMTTRAQREHVTRYFYDHPQDYRIFNFTAEKNYSALKLSVDTQEEFDRADELIRRMDRPHWDYRWREIVADLCATSR